MPTSNWRIEDLVKGDRVFEQGQFFLQVIGIRRSFRFGFFRVKFRYPDGSKCCQVLPAGMIVLVETSE